MQPVTEQEYLAALTIIRTYRDQIDGYRNVIAAEVRAVEEYVRPRPLLPQVGHWIEFTQLGTRTNVKTGVPYKVTAAEWRVRNERRADRVLMKKGIDLNRWQSGDKKAFVDAAELEGFEIYTHMLIKDGKVERSISSFTGYKYFIVLPPELLTGS